MKDQHTLTQGYRDLSADEIDKINRIKIAECQVLELIGQIALHLQDQQSAAEVTNNGEEVCRIAESEPGRWLAIARTDIQTGFMALVRSVAQPRPNKLGPKS